MRSALFPPIFHLTFNKFVTQCAAVYTIISIRKKGMVVVFKELHCMKLKKITALALILATVVSLCACGATASAPAAASECTCSGDASACTCCGNCCASNSQPAQATPVPAAEDTDFDSRLAGSWTLVSEEIHGALGEIKNSSVPDGSNMYISLDGGVSGEIFDAVTRALKVSFGANTVFEPLGTITSDNGRLDITGLLPDNSGITINKTTYAFSDVTKGSYKSCTHNASFAGDTDNRLKLNISCTVDGTIVHGDIDVSLTFERIYPVWAYSSDGSKGKYLLMDALEGKWQDNYENVWDFALDVKSSEASTVLNFSVTDKDGAVKTGVDFLAVESDDGLGVDLTFAFDSSRVNGRLQYFDGSTLTLTTDMGETLTLKRVS